MALRSLEFRICPALWIPLRSGIPGKRNLGFSASDFELSYRIIHPCVTSVISFLVEEVFINHAYKLSSTNVQDRLVDKLFFDNPTELPPLYKRLYHLFEQIFSKPKSDIDKATPYLLEKIAALVIENQRNLQAKNNCKFYLDAQSNPLRFKYIDDNAKSSYHDEVDVLAYDSLPRSNLLGECKRSVERYQKNLGHIYGFLDYLVSQFHVHSKVDFDILFTYPDDRSGRFHQILANTTRTRTVYSLALRKWKLPPTSHAP